MKPVSYDTCARAIDTDLNFPIARILRFFASHGLVSEVAEDTFEANRLTKTLSVNGYHAGDESNVSRHKFEINFRLLMVRVTNTCPRFHIIAPAITKAPDFFRETKFQNPDNIVNTPL